MIDLTGKVALVTGSSRGIGRGCAVEMARCGADVAVNYRSHADEAEEVAEEIRSLGRKAAVFGVDVSDRAAVDDMVQGAVSELGRLDILVSNAYRTVRKPFLELTEEDVRATWDVTFMGAFHATQAGARQMAAQGEGGAVLFISSVLSFIPMPLSAPYNACKAGMAQLAATMARELAPQRIRVNVIEPGWIDTPGERQFTTDDEIRQGAEQLPWKRLGTIEDIGRAAAFICSPAADYVNAEVMRVDGGYWFEHGLSG